MNLFIEVINCNDCNGVRDVCDKHSEKLLNSATKNDKPESKSLINTLKKDNITGEL